ncbi:MAG TPA: HD domain-containing phosphohydrolase [Vicinamibacterales bacterium]|nr:HD domain-containing phosphohydrolase [Vicinamibacterales bacterium]
MALAEAPSTVKLSSILSGLSYALDLTEGHPRGHASRSCLIGMRIGRALGLSADDQSNLFYALLLKDAGCSSNSARVFQLFGGDDQTAKRGAWMRDWRKIREQIAYVIDYAEPEGKLFERLRRLAVLAAKGPASRRTLFEVRCDRGAEIARTLGFSKATAEAIRSMDEHWDGGGYPDGTKRHDIPILARIIGLAQVAEIFASEEGPDKAATVAKQRRGSWFDPDLVDLFLDLSKDQSMWDACGSQNLEDTVADAEPQDSVITADGKRLDDIAEAFAWVIDAKSPYTYHHSQRVADFAVAIAHALGLDANAVTRLRRAALLHDIGKLSVPNRILDKPGKLTTREWEVVKLHPYYTYQILERVPVFGELAFDASAHHERMDGRGYFRNLPGDLLSPSARILAAADQLDALSAERPYRGKLPTEKVLSIMREERGNGLWPDAVDVVERVLDSSNAAT